MSSQEEATQKPATSNEQPRTTAQSEADPSNVPDETKPEPSGTQQRVEVRLQFARSKAVADNYSCSKGELEDRHRTTFMFPFGSRYRHGFVVAVRAIVAKRTERAMPRFQAMTCNGTFYIFPITRIKPEVCCNLYRPSCSVQG